VKNKVVITAAVTGSIHTPTMSPHLPITPEEIANDAVGAAEAGAAEVHIHARDPESGRPSSDLSLFAEIVERVKSRSNVIICISTGGGKDMTVEERVSAVPKFKPELASLNMGSMNFGMFPMVKRYETWIHEWEKPFLESTRDFIFRNTFSDIQKILGIMKEAGTKPEMEIYDVGHLYNLLHIKEEVPIDEPVYIQFVTGIVGGIGASLENLMFLKSTADRLLGKGGYRWSAIGAGRMQFPICATAALLGGGCRVGLEDNLNLDRGTLAESSAQLVEKMVRILGEFSLKPATPNEAREMLGLR
jgi:uncharacterized protein (DUF849 family)